MKTNRSILTLAMLAAFIFACEKREVLREDSPYITVSSPARNQSLEDKDSVTIEAVIEPKNTSVAIYYVWLMDHEKNIIIQKKQECDCKGMTAVHVKESFKFDISKTADLLLHVDATMEDGTNIREEVPFKLVDSKK